MRKILILFVCAVLHLTAMAQMNDTVHHSGRKSILKINVS
ncbi:MAG: hypothetical protein JWN76_2403, partial [Chitinophagaceae bacterium]|nr:hypothetical protein [Chitinophagaceae bacterium]